MIRGARQNWAVGALVRVGFLKLTVRAALPTPGDGLPDAYFLSNQGGDKLYRFTPYYGLERISLEEAERQIGELKTECERIAASSLARAAKREAAMERLFGEAA
jgi:uncharacterized small protein (DUF1192 family)